MSKAKIIVVEDDTLIRLDITKTLEHAKYEVVGSFADDIDAEKFLEQNDVMPDIALLDINLRGKNEGIQLAGHINQQYKFPFIFLTSYTDTATIQNAFAMHPASYIVKPFDAEDLLINVELALFKQHNSRQKKINPQSAFYIKTASKLLHIQPENISAVQSLENYSQIFIDGEKHLISRSLKTLSEELDASMFMRVHKSYLVNLQQIDYIHEDVVHIGSLRIPVGRQYRQALMNSLTIL